MPEHDDGHPVGNPDCDLCWEGYPRPCEGDGCDGLVHAVFGDESWDGYFLWTRCDVCGEAE